MMRYLRRAVGWGVRFCVRHVFALGVLSTAAVYLGLSQVSSASHPALYTWIAALGFIGLCAGSLHMLYDRRTHDWDPMSTAIILILVGMTTLFGYFWLTRARGTDAGTREALLDLVAACVLVGMPLWLLVIGCYQWRWRHGQDATRPSDQVAPGWRGPDRRSGEQRRSSDQARDLELASYRERNGNTPRWHRDGL